MDNAAPTAPSYIGELYANLKALTTNGFAALADKAKKWPVWAQSILACAVLALPLWMYGAFERSAPVSPLAVEVHKTNKAVDDLKTKLDEARPYQATKGDVEELRSQIEQQRVELNAVQDAVARLNKPPAASPVVTGSIRKKR